MSSLEERQSTFESKFAHDEELIFKTNAKITKLFGLWVAEQLELDGAEAESYAEQLVMHDLLEPGFQDVLDKAAKDLPDIPMTRLELELEKCQNIVHNELNIDTAE